MDFTENRFRGYCDRVLSGDILCETGNEDETCFQRHTAVSYTHLTLPTT